MGLLHRKTGGGTKAIKEQPPTESDKLELALSKVCFTHFIYISKQPSGAKLTHDLLRYAYRRTAAIVVEEGRRGIDWIIPVRIDEDTFIGYVGQDKNRINDKLHVLTDEANDETHQKLNCRYFLTDEEYQSFPPKAMAKHWPCALFAVGVEEMGVAATEIARPRTRMDGLQVLYDFPCLVFTGMDYMDITDTEGNAALIAFRDFERPVADKFQNSIPITYGH